MTRDDSCCFIGFQNFSGEDPRTPLLTIKILCDLFFNTTLLNTNPLVQIEVSNLEVNKQE